MSFKVDLHVHTDASSDGISTLEEQARAAQRVGLHAIAVTDHNACTPVPEKIGDVLLIPGCEVSTTEGHITGVFLRQPLDFALLRQNGLPTGEEAVREIHRRGGIAVLAHPYQSERHEPAAFLFRTDGVETANARANFKIKTANDKAKKLAEEWRVSSVGGSDAHSQHEVGNAYTLVESDELTLTALRSALLAGRCASVLVRDTPHFRKGFSQWRQAVRTGGMQKRLRAMAYVAYCFGRDILQH